MSQTLISCPKCGHKFELREIAAREFEEQKQHAIESAVAHALQEAQKENDRRVVELEQSIQREKEQRQEAEKNEKQLRDKAQELAEREAKIELTLQRHEEEVIKKHKQQSDERMRLSIQAAKDELAQDYDLKLAQREQQLADARKQVAEFQRKLDQGSQQTQGEVLEIEVERHLRAAFPFDVIEEVGKGRKGADIIQKVYNDRRQPCGTIIWEVKNTKSWNNQWIEKLKEDAAREKATAMVIVSTALPENITTIGIVDDVWVCTYAVSVGLATALREQLIHVDMIQRSLVNQGDKVNEIYKYMTSPLFKKQVSRIVEAFQLLDKEIDKERTAMETIWKTRKAHLQKVISQTQDMYAELMAITGNEMPSLEAFTLEGVAGFIPDTTFSQDDLPA